jgi:hypothetical protein
MVLLKTKFLDVRTFTTLTLLYLITSCGFSFLIAGMNTRIFPA